MSKRLFSLIAVLAVIGLILPLSGSGLAQGPGRFDRSLLKHERPVVDGELHLPAGARGGPLSQRGDLVQVVIELKDEPTTQTFAAAEARNLSAVQATSEAQTQLERIEQSQQALLASLAEMGATVIYRVQRVYNGIAVQVDASRLAEIRQLPNVKDVHTLIPEEIDHTTSVPLIGAPQVWDSGGLGLTGQNIKIGVIDTGIDYLHANFGGSGGITGTLYISNNTTIVGDVPGFPGVKVVGGYDFVGDNYNANGTGAELIPQPDPDPMDCYGHGSHVAGTAAGYGVDTDGATYTGPYSSTLAFTSTFRIGPGVAPEAELYALRVFGCEGSTNVTVQAIEWAVDPNGDGDFSDHLDVINMSLGSDYGSAFDPSAVASDNAVLAGVIVVISAGNDSDAYYVTGSPGTSSRAVSVAASVDSSSVVGAFEVRPPSPLAGLHSATEAAFGPDLADIGNITDTLAYPSSQANGCATFNITNTLVISGNIALIDRGVCTFKTKVRNAQSAGATGVLIANNVVGFPITMGDDPTVTTTITIPSMMTTLAVGNALKGQLPSPGLTVVLTAQYRNQFLVTEPSLVDTIPAFTSRGPRRGGSALKPDIAAPGDTVFSTAHGTGDEGASMGGTSMSAPHVAGSMALLRQLYPLWTIEELKALVMNTALHDLRSTTTITSTLFGPARVGAGRIDVANASEAQAVAYNAGAPGQVSVSFGAPEVVGSATAVRRIRVLNKSSQTLTYNVRYDGVTDVPGASYSLSHASITLPPFGFTNIVVTMTADAALMKHSRDATVASTQLGLPRHWISEESGHVILVPVDSTFAASLTGLEETPPVSTGASGTATFTYAPATRVLSYTLEVSNIVSVTAAHIHRGLPGVAGGIAYPLNAPNPPTTTATSGAVTLSAADERLLLGGALYVNVHTVANPGGEIRGQVLGATGQALRVPVYAAPRPASDMAAVQSTLTFGASPVISLTGIPVNTAGTGTPVFPNDELSVVAALELQGSSPDDASSDGILNNADLKYVGVTSDFRATGTITNPAGTITDTTIFFGIATHGNWTTPNEVEFDIYIDTNRDGTDDFVLFNWDWSSANNGVDPNDVFITLLKDLNTGELFLEDFLNGVPANALNTAPFNTNVMVLPVYAADLGLTNANSAFNYYVVSFSRDASGPEDSVTGFFEGVVDVSRKGTYNAGDPGLDFTGGVTGVPAYSDLPGEAIPVGYDLPAYVAANSQGVLLLHSHNAVGSHDEVVAVTVSKNYLPIIMK